MLEFCTCCQAYAPAWDDPDYADWHIALTPDGEYLGVVCVGCHIDDELAFAGFVLPPSVADQLGRRRAARRQRAAARERSDRAAA